MKAVTQLPFIMLSIYRQIKEPWFKDSVALNGLSYGMTYLFDSFVPRQSMNEGTTSMEIFILEKSPLSPSE